VEVTSIVATGHFMVMMALNALMNSSVTELLETFRVEDDATVRNSEQCEN
jgi:hypothetical protein